MPAMLTAGWEATRKNRLCLRLFRSDAISANWAGDGDACAVFESWKAGPSNSTANRARYITPSGELVRRCETTHCQSYLICFKTRRCDRRHMRKLTSAAFILILVNGELTAAPDPTSAPSLSLRRSVSTRDRRGNSAHPVR